MKRDVKLTGKEAALLRFGAEILLSDDATSPSDRKHLINSIAIINGAFGWQNE